jgi:uncharacterized protein YyaL (SSP411 family)
MLSAYMHRKAGQISFSNQQLHDMFNNIMQSADKQEGGFGNAPKFPQLFTIQYLLRYYHYFKEPEALKQACLSLDKMISGGIYDHIGGGLARYSTDREWIIPHFEKMLYDNALFVSTLSEAYQLTHDDHYLKTLNHTLEFLFNELSLQLGDFIPLSMQIARGWKENIMSGKRRNCKRY